MRRARDRPVRRIDLGGEETPDSGTMPLASCDPSGLLGHLARLLQRIPSSRRASTTRYPQRWTRGRASMCDRHGDRSMPDMAGLSRRGFLKTGAAATGGLVIGLHGGLFGAAQAAAGGSLKSTHGTGFCNLALFLAHARQIAKEDGVTLDFVNTPTFAEHVTFLGAGLVDVGVLPYTSFMALYDAGAPVRIVAGGGVEGCAIVSQAGLKTAQDLKGKTLGTFQLDTLEVLPYDYLKKNGVSMKDVTVRYMGNTPEAVEAFKSGALDWICTIEPYASAILNDKPGTVLLSNGTDIYGPGYTDCVLCARSELIQQKPELLKALIKAMMKAQLAYEQDRDGVLKELVGTYYKTSMDNAIIGSGKQPPVVDMRSQTSFILDRTDSLIEMGYIKKKPGRDAIDWTLLEQVIAENGEVYQQLKRKSATA
jgi:NitT/TauT family transport system substrate-binding protein